MRNKIKLFNLILIMVFTFSFTACAIPQTVTETAVSAEQGMKEALIEFDKQYYSTIFDSEQLKECFALRNEMEQKYSDTINLDTQGDEVAAIMNKMKTNYEYLLNSLENLGYPELLKELIQLDKQYYKNNIILCDTYIDTFESYKNGSLTEEKNRQNNMKIQELLVEDNKLVEQSDTIMREIYGNYGLDDLLTKYPASIFSES